MKSMILFKHDWRILINILQLITVYDESNAFFFGKSEGFLLASNK